MSDHDHLCVHGREIACLECVDDARAERAEAEQQIELLAPGGRYCWKQRAEQAEAALAALDALALEIATPLGAYTANAKGTLLGLRDAMAAARALLRDGAVLIRGYGDGKYPDYPEGLLAAIDQWIARLDAALGGQP